MEDVTTRVWVHHSRAKHVHVCGSHNGWLTANRPGKVVAPGVSVFELQSPPDVLLELKPLLDMVWANGANIRTEPGTDVSLYPTFVNGPGRVQTLFHGFYSERLDNERDIYAYTPPGCDESSARYPVIYFNDGEHLFANAGDRTKPSLELEFTLDAMIAEGKIPPVIAIGIPAMGDARMAEYAGRGDSPWGFEGRGDDYLHFVFHELKPQVDARLPTLPGRDSTAFFGTSMGARNALYAGTVFKDSVGRVGGLSPTGSEWNDDGLARAIQSGVLSPRGLSRIWVDRGEIGSSGWDDATEPLLQAIRSVGIRENEGVLMSWYEPGADHSVEAWRARIGRALQHLLN
jgi:enterochelin esterase-like enzyme